MTKNNKDILLGFKYLNVDWNGYGANPIDNSIIDKACKFLDLFSFQPEVFPLASNGVQFEWENADGLYIEFCIYADNYSYLVMSKDKVITELENCTDIDLNTIVTEINNLVNGFNIL